MGCDARVALRGRGVGGHQPDENMQQFHHLTAPHITRVGPQEAVQR